MTPPLEPSPRIDAGQLWRRFHGELLGFVRGRVDSDAASEDILQAAFLRAHLALAEGRVPDEPRAWLYQIARNLIKDTYRTRGRQAALTTALKDERLEESSDPLGSRDERDAFQLVARALPYFISNLDAPFRQALQLTELEGLTHAQAAEQAGVTLACMKARVRRGREHVHAALLRCCTFEVDARGKMTACAPRRSGPTCGSCS